MNQEILSKTISVIELVLEKKSCKIIITEESSMENTSDWDSLSFINIFLAINEAFSINPDTDDALNYISVISIVDFVRNELQES
jgi:acyl carrier protein